MFSLEERSRAVELYLTTPMTTAQVVECLGYPTRQCLERWLAMDPRYAGRMAKPIIPLETRRKAIELVLGGMQQKQAAKQLGVSVGAVHNWVRAYRRGGMAALQPRNQNAAQGGKSASVRPRGGADAGGVFLCFCQLLGELTCRDSGWLSWARFALPVASGVLSRVARF
ncbi:helix-turn-helix domain-containing protein, partial [Bifidobacterium longum]|uniref:helix-turn-helix domain-containing protein n=1 Tax=Bifidobacterium longum TaxID=216816 RepID=UPI0021174B48